MYAEYKAKITGDISGLEKILKKANGSLNKLTDNDFVIKLDYDGNIQTLNRVMNEAIKACPDLTIQFQYDVNKKMLDQRIDELKQIESFKIDIDTNKVQGKIRDMVSDIKNGFESAADSEEETIGKLKELFKYVGTASSLGIKTPKVLEDLMSIDDYFDGLVKKMSGDKTLKLFETDGTIERTLERTKEDINEITNALEYFRTKGASDTGFTAPLENTAKAARDTEKALSNLYDKFADYFALKGGKDVSGFWDELKLKIDEGDEELKAFLADLKLLDETGKITPIRGGSNNSGGIIGSENVLVARTNTHYKNGSDAFSNSQKLKKALDEAYDSGVNVARILEIVGEREDEVFFEIQEKAAGKTLGSYGFWEGTEALVNPEFFEATDEQIQKLIKDIKTLEKSGMGVDISLENITYDKAKGFSILDLTLDPTNYKDDAEMFEDIITRIAGDAEQFYEDLSDEKGLAAAEAFRNRMTSIADALNEVSNASSRAKSASVPEAFDDNSKVEAASGNAGKAISDVTEKIKEEGIVAEEAAKQKEKFAKANEHVAAVSKPELYTEDSGQLSLIKDLTSAEKGLADSMEEVSAEARDSAEQIEGQLSLDFSKATEDQKKYELAIINTNSELQRMVELAFKADTKTGSNDTLSKLGAQAEAERKAAEETARRTAEIEEQNRQIEEQHRILMGAADAAFRMDTGQTGNQLITRFTESYRKVQEEVDRLVEKTQAEMNTQFSQLFTEDSGQLSFIKDLTSAEMSLADSMEEVSEKAKESASQIKGQLTLQEVVQESDDARASINKLIEDVEKFNNADKYTEGFLESVRALQKRLKETSQQPFITSEQLKELENAKKALQAFSKLDINKSFKELTRTKFLDQISSYLTKYTGLSKSTRMELEGIASAMKKAGSMGELKDLYNQFLNIKIAARAAGEEAQSFFTNIKHRLSDMNAKFIAQFLSWQDLLRYLREVAQNVIGIDSALTELRKVSDATNERLQQSFETSAKSAQKLGSVIKDVINITSDWARLGYDVDAAEELARVTTLFKTVGDNMTADDASSYLVSTLQGFQMAADQSEEIVDKYNEVANHFAIDTAGIGQALQRSAASFNAANTDLSKSIALVTATNEVVQNPESVGTLWKTMAARIRGAKTELEELGVEEDEFTQTTSKLRDMVKSLTGFDIMKSATEYKDIYEIILGIGKEWDKLSDIQQASLGEALAGRLLPEYTVMCT